MAEVEIPVGYGNAVLTWISSWRSDPITVTLGYATAGTFIDANGNAEAIRAAAVSTAGSNSCAAPGTMTTAWQFTSVHVYERRVAGPLVRGDSTPGTTVGTIAGGVNEMVLSSTVRVSKRTAFVGRQYRGRMYAPVTRLEADVLGNGAWATGIQTIIQASWSKFFTNLTALPILPYLLHSDPALAPTQITSFFVQPRIGTQRRRLL